MNQNMRFLQSTDSDSIFQYERERLKKEVSEEDAIFLEWKASWRPESLEFYLPNGWCFGIFDVDEKLTAYFLAQPILFYHGHMQTLWVEHVAANTLEQKQKLIEVAYKTSKEKHLQKLLFKKDCVDVKDFSTYSFKESQGQYFELTTTKMDNP